MNTLIIIGIVIISITIIATIWVLTENQKDMDAINTLDKPKTGDKLAKWNECRNSGNSTDECMIYNPYYIQND